MTLVVPCTNVMCISVWHHDYSNFNIVGNISIFLDLNIFLIYVNIYFLF